MDNHDIENKGLGEKPTASHNETIEETSLLMDGEGKSMMDRLLADKQRTFWLFQAMGWGGYALFRLFTGYANGYFLSEYVGITIMMTFVGFLSSLMLRQLYRQTRAISLFLSIGAALVASTGFGMLQSAFVIKIAPYFVPDFGVAEGLSLLGNLMLETLTLLAWSGLYFGYQFYVDLQRARERVLKATAMAHQAQLKMLRYQLNPHFLFNTLNAISTLVLEKESVDANKMLTKLSNFLRYTLVNQPTQRVSLEQELYALGLYLDIEEVRFEDRLDVRYEIEDDAREGLIPSLIMQPLVENAIKYAVAPSETGGMISFAAAVDHAQGQLILKLSDNGPGIDDIDNPVGASVSSGVGIANTRDRLQQIYGDDHSMELKNTDPKGLAITIKIPFEKT